MRGMRVQVRYIKRMRVYMTPGALPGSPPVEHDRDILETGLFVGTVVRFEREGQQSYVHFSGKMPYRVPADRILDMVVVPPR